MDRNQLAELEVEEDGFKVRLRKRGEGAAVQTVGVPAIAGVAAPGPSAVPAAAGEPAADAIPEEKLIRAPMVGTFYRSPSPETDPFIELGDTIEEGQTLCIIEAMKVMNEVKAEQSGTLEAILVENSEPVEFGTPLFRIT